MGMQQGNDQQNVMVLIGVVVPKEPNCVRDTEVVVVETGKEGISLIVIEDILTGPVYVVFSEPEEVVVLQVYACTEEVRQRWVAIM